LHIALLEMAKRSSVTVSPFGALIGYPYILSIIFHILMINQRMGLETYGMINNILKKLLGKIAIQSGFAGQFCYLIQQLFLTGKIPDIFLYINLKGGNFTHQILALRQCFNDGPVCFVKKFSYLI